MNIAKTKEAIENTPDNDELDFPTAWFALDYRRITTANLKALAASHTRLSTNAAEVVRLFGDGLRRGESLVTAIMNLRDAVEEAEK